jgi:hypothetical protein
VFKHIARSVRRLLARRPGSHAAQGAASGDGGSSLPHGITFDERGLKFRGEHDGTLMWSTPSGDVLALYNFPIPPDIQADLDHLDDLRTFYRRTVTPAGLGVIEVETREIDGCRVVRTIFKAAQQPEGRIYLGGLTFPFRDCSYVLKIQCEEGSMTGLRDTFVLSKLIKSGEVQLAGAVDRIPNWLDDPYDPNEVGPMTRNKSERPEYDAEFPDHPLTRARALLNHLEQTVAIAAAVKQRPGFVWRG